MDTTKYYLLIADIYKEVQDNKTITVEQVNQFKELWLNATDLEYNETLTVDALMEHVMKVLDVFEEDTETIKGYLENILDVILLIFIDINKEYYIKLFEFYNAYNDVANAQFADKIAVAEQLIGYNHPNVFVQAKICVILLGWYIISPKDYLLSIQEVSLKLKAVLPSRNLLYASEPFYSTIFSQ